MNKFRLFCRAIWQSAIAKTQIGQTAFAQSNEEKIPPEILFSNKFGGLENFVYRERLGVDKFIL
ncbi:hypothetical protein [uncultured Fibrobacter sp.]|uniref:hypothetical protein n=1 Tax=uncultured Fibrobacter sp. TaxID=261512 RepID=UPI0025EFF863|nr:hypothetical protein [uncultured Fibrobacter sp.]